jgi:hypothetical protein
MARPIRPIAGLSRHQTDSRKPALPQPVKGQDEAPIQAVHQVAHHSLIQLPLSRAQSRRCRVALDRGLLRDLSRFAVAPREPITRSEMESNHV